MYGLCCQRNHTHYSYTTSYNILAVPCTMGVCAVMHCHSACTIKHECPAGMAGLWYNASSLHLGSGFIVHVVGHNSLSDCLVYLILILFHHPMAEANAKEGELASHGSCTFLCTHVHPSFAAFLPYSSSCCWASTGLIRTIQTLCIKNKK